MSRECESLIYYVITGLLYTGVVTSALCMWLQSAIFKRVSATDASIILSAEPLFACVFAFIILGEQLSISDVFGGLLIILACSSNEFNLINGLIDRLNKQKQSALKTAPMSDSGTVTVMNSSLLDEGINVLIDTGKSDSDLKTI